MSQSIVELHDGALESTGRIVREIAGDQWEASTPCEEWNVRELTNHVVAGNLWAGELAAGKTIDDVGDGLDGDLLGEDPARAYEHSAKIASDVFKAPGALEAPCAVSYGPVPGEVYAGHRFIDVLVHGWDLARATGQPTTLDPDLVQGAINVIEPQLELLRASGMFGTDVQVPEGADAETTLLAWLGRSA